MIYRIEKGAPLTNAEVDNNFREILAREQSGLTTLADDFATRAEMNALSATINNQIGILDNEITETNKMKEKLDALAKHFIFAETLPNEADNGTLCILTAEKETEIFYLRAQNKWIKIL